MPTDSEVRQDRPGACSKCGRALEAETIIALPTKVEWTCPMHPEIVRDAPGSCLICGMALEPRTIQIEEDNSELHDTSRRFWISTLLTVPLGSRRMTQVSLNRTRECAVRMCLE